MSLERKKTAVFVVILPCGCHQLQTQQFLEELQDRGTGRAAGPSQPRELRPGSVIPGVNPLLQTLILASFDMSENWLRELKVHLY